MKRLIGGQPLYTKDALVFSNASVICVGNSGKTITYQIRSEYGNIGILKENDVAEWFDLHRQEAKEEFPRVSGMPGGGFTLTVGEAHAANIKTIVPPELYSIEINDLNVCSFIVQGKHWTCFSELLCLSNSY
ncbi:MULTISPECIES: hypothetical protein [unclassified Pseudomonas]|uniref:hypothetical protein n=1 Tax=unclassified Pseudomonas TaxID=196821 RepID=UPI000C86E454|nr:MULTISPECIES: hypothetical protein [unclassified Pseudomonas]PMV96434.1 hypothetical protein C1X55_19050 [Pseudomonas sp. GW460-C8]PMW23342.1 hypothetical protein C1X53_12350 [Pseudomonas sp. GW456-E6]PMW24182.1 hypothetical protein C1X40_05035 [Pseudomonas sp. GW456-11-11-14-TSB2]PMW40076.1 hypothetical protein C1X45_08345 [Pseudomonas sp. GW460-7]PMW41187.1 hypothetical protein C1X48_06980 [Pseudomonas sp. FW305-3-2-15-A-R2A1]